jgi:hypothetical protein
MMKNTKPKPREWAKNIAEASRLTAITRATLTAYKSAGCAAFRSNGKVNLIELTEWAEVNGRRTRLDSDAMKTERLRILRATAERLERENAIKRAEIVEFSKVQRALTVGLARFGSNLMRLFGSELPPILAGQDALTIEHRLTQALAESFAEMKSGEIALWTPADTENQQPTTTNEKTSNAKS